MDSAAMICSSACRHVHNMYNFINNVGGEGDQADLYLASKKRVPTLSKKISWKGEGVDGFRGNDLQFCLQSCT
jgi:hypothetical protein